MIIETKRLLLRNFEKSDTNNYCNLTSDSKYQRFYSEEDCSVEKSRFLVEQFILQTLEEKRSKYQMAIVLKDTGDFIGTAGLRIEQDKQASIGCGIGRNYQSAGYAIEAMYALLKYGFEEHDIHRVYAETISENTPAIWLCEMLGLREEARLIENRYFKGQWWSTVVMAMLKEEWSN
ncbi:GNAT family N-acetyltransferase [Reinekea forsetii]|nr:GNAT family N-acetyltransferase [Reinekea forsetii]